MTTSQQAALEQVASKAMKTIAPMLRNGVGPETKEYQWAKDAIIEALAAQRVALLEEVARRYDGEAVVHRTVGRHDEAEIFERVARELRQP